MPCPEFSFLSGERKQESVRDARECFRSVEWRETRASLTLLNSKDPPRTTRGKSRARARALVDAERQSRIRHAVESPLAVTRWPRDRPRLTQNRECNERDDQFLTGRNGIDTRRAASATRASGPKVGGT